MGGYWVWLTIRAFAVGWADGAVAGQGNAVFKGLGNEVAADYGNAVYHIPTPPLTLPRDCWSGQRGAMEMMENR